MPKKNDKEVKKMRKIIIAVGLVLVSAVAMSADIPERRILNAVYDSAKEVLRIDLYDTATSTTGSFYILGSLPAGTNKIGALSETEVIAQDPQLQGRTWSYSAGETTASGTFTISGYVVSGWIAMDSSTSGTTCTFRLNQGDLKEIKSGEVENFKFPVYPATLPINIEYLAPAGRIRYHFDKVS